MDGGATWRQRYEHLAGLVAGITKESDGKVSWTTLVRLPYGTMTEEILRDTN